LAGRWCAGVRNSLLPLRTETAATANSLARLSAGPPPTRPAA
jgi:hypothetical protein